MICASVNDAALHDIPGRRRLKDGDLLSIDTGATLDGWTADAAISVQVGHPHQEDTRLIDTTARALQAGIAAAVPGGRLGDISAAIGAAGHAAGYGVPADFGGHGIGRTMHEDPHIPNAGRPGRGLRLVPGLVIAIEPWFLARRRQVRDRPQRLDRPQHRRQPRRPRRAHCRHHQRRARHPHRARLTSTGSLPVHQAAVRLSARQ